MTNEEAGAFAREVFASQPFSRFIGARLIARAEAKSVGKRQAVCQCEVYAAEGDEEQLCALAQGTVVAAE